MTTAFHDEPAVPNIVDNAGHAIVLSDGSRQTLAGLDRGELLALQWHEEQVFARRILAAPKGSSGRSAIVRQAYDTVTQIFAAAQGNHSAAPLMGVHPRHQRLVVELLRHQRARIAGPLVRDRFWGRNPLESRR